MIFIRHPPLPESGGWRIIMNCLAPLDCARCLLLQRGGARQSAKGGAGWLAGCVRRYVLPPDRILLTFPPGWANQRQRGAGLLLGLPLLLPLEEAVCCWPGAAWRGCIRRAPAAVTTSHQQTADLSLLLASTPELLLQPAVISYLLLRSTALLFTRRTQ